MAETIPLDFKKLLSARFLFTFAVQMQAVVVGWRMYDLMHDPLYLGFIGLAEAVPALGLALYAGHVIDKSRPLIVYRRVLFVSFLSGFLVWACHTLPFLFDHQVVALYIASVLTGTARAFSQPAIYAIVPRLVARENLSKASAWTSTTMQVARIAGPAFGGIIFGWFGITASAAIVTCVLLLAAVSVSLISVLQLHPNKNAQSMKISESLMSGVRFVFSHKILLPALSLDMISVMFGGVTALLPIFAKEILLIGPKGLGALRAAPAVGAALMGFILTRWNIKKEAGRLLLSSIAGFGVCILIFGISRNYLLSFAALLFSGAFDSISMVIRGSAVQLASPDHMRGRISSVNSIFIGSSNEIGELESGIAAKLFGTINSVLIGGAVCLATVLFVTLSSPTLRNLDLEKIDSK